MIKNSTRTINGCIYSTKSYNNFIRNIFKGKETTLSWNISLPFRIGKKGNIKENSCNKAIDDVRNSYGIDLTAYIELEPDAIAREKDRITEIIKNNVSDSKVEKYRKRLAKFLNRNDTFNKYYLRRRKLRIDIVEKLIASFLLITKQIEYSKEKEKYVFNLGRFGTFYKVNDFKSYDKQEPFYQKVFTDTYYIKAKDVRDIKKSKTPLLQFLKENPNALEKSNIKFNERYKEYILNKTKKLSLLLSKQDAREILKAIYNAKVILKICETKEFEDKINSSFTSFVELFQKEENKSALRKAIKGCFPGSRLKNKQIDNFLACFKGYLSTYFISIDSLNERVKKEIGNKYVLKTDLASILKEKIKDNYVLKSELEKTIKERIKDNYVLKSELGGLIKEKIKDNYVLKSELEKIIKERIEEKYVLKSEFEKLKKRFS